MNYGNPYSALIDIVIGSWPKVDYDLVNTLFTAHMKGIFTYNVTCTYLFIYFKERIFESLVDYHGFLTEA